MSSTIQPRMVCAAGEWPGTAVTRTMVPFPSSTQAKSFSSRTGSPSRAA